MPELPEVEIIKQELALNIIGKEVKETFSKNITLRQKLIPEVNILTKQKIISVKRRNKYILFYFDSHYLVIHLGMTGQIILNKFLNIQKHTHFYLNLGDIYLSYIDPRRFGLIAIFDNSILEKDNPYLKGLGIEPLDKDFTFEKFDEIISKYKKNIKKFLMDSKIICGIGNIYASEILFLSKVSPLRKTDSINLKEKKELFKFIRIVLEKAISLGGSSISDFIHTNGSTGQMQNFYNVYNYENQKCKICHNPILKIKQFGRSTYYCKYCQK
jgi:formamidopyrimidine-DNA glycosylase